MTEITKYEFTRAEAATWIRRAPTGAKFAVHIRIDAPIAGKPDYYIQDGCAGSVGLSRPQAIELVQDLLTDDGEKERGKRIPCSEYVSGDYVCYWIG